MPSTYTVNLGIEKPATGEQSGTWGDTTNVNFDILDQAINGAERVTLTSAGSSGSPNTLQISNGATSDGRNKWIEFYSASDLGGDVFVQLDPNDAEKIVFVRNSLAGSQSILLFQGTYDAGRDLEIPAGVDMVIKFDGGGASAATVTDVFTKLRATEITTPTLTATTADINGGTIDNSVIGGSTAAAVTGTTVVANTSLNIAGDGATVTGIKDEDDMSSDSPTKLATQQSIKAYVDSQVGTVDTWAEVLANGATSGSTNPEVTAGQALKTDTINETSAGSGVTIDSVLLKDDVVNATDVETGSISANDGTASATIADTTGNFTITNFISNSVDIGGGAIDGTTIGGSSAAAGSFTTLTGATINATTSLNIAGDGATVTGIKDEDDMASNSATKLATQQSIKAYVDSQVGTVDTLAEILANGNTTGSNDIDVDAAQKVQFRDAAIYINSSVDGQLDIVADTEIQIAATTIDINGAATFNEVGGDYDFRVESDGNSHMLFVDAGNNRVGIGVTAPQSAFHINDNGGPQSSGDMNTGLIVSNGALGSAIQMGTNDASGFGYIKSAYVNSSETARALLLYTGTAKAVSVESGETVINDDSLDRDFRVESDGNSHMLFVDAGSNEVGIGTSSPEAVLHTETSAATTAMFSNSVAGFGALVSRNTSASGFPGFSLSSWSTWTTAKETGQIRFDGLTSTGVYTVYGGIYLSSGTNTSTGAPSSMKFATSDGTASATERMRIDSSGNVGIGTASPTVKLEVNGNIKIGHGGSADGNQLVLSSSGYSDWNNDNISGSWRLYNGATERMRIDGSGNVCIGTTTPEAVLHTETSAAATAMFSNSVAGLGTLVSRNTSAFGTPGFSLSSGTWTTAKETGQIRFDGLTSTGVYTVYGGIYLSSGTNTSTGAPSSMTFSTSDGTASATERMRIDSSGNVGIGTTSPSKKLEVYASSNSLQIEAVVRNDQSGSGVAAIGFNVSANAAADTSASKAGIGLERQTVQGVGALCFYNSASTGTADFTTSDERMRIDSSGNVLVGYTSSNGAYKLQVNSQIFATSATIATSDGNYKENITPLGGALSLVSQLNPVQFDWKAHPVHEFDRNQPTIGFIAQEVQQVLAEQPYLNSIVKSNECVLEPEETDDEGNVIKEAVTEPFLGIAEGNMVALLTSALQEAISKIETLETEMTALQARVTTLEGA